MIKLEIYEDNGTLIVNGPALKLLTEEEYKLLKELGTSLKSRLQHTKKGNNEHESN